MRVPTQRGGMEEQPIFTLISQIVAQAPHDRHRMIIAHQF